MTTWNYRVIKNAGLFERHYTPGTDRLPDTTYVTFGVHTVYYEDGKIIGWSELPVELGGYDSFDEARADADRIAEAFQRPVLTPDATGKSLRPAGWYAPEVAS